MAVPGKVDSDRGSAQRKRHRVPGVRVLRPTVDEDDLGGLIPPRQQAERPSVVESNRAALHRRQLRYVETKFSDVLCEQSELVVRSHSGSVWGVAHDVEGTGQPCWEAQRTRPIDQPPQAASAYHRRPLTSPLTSACSDRVMVVVVLVVSGTAVVVVVAATVVAGGGTGHGGV